MTDLVIPIELIEQAQRGNCVLFVGAGISVSQNGLPSGAQLAEELAHRCGYREQDMSLPKVAQHYEMMLGRQALISYLCDRLDSPRYKPSDAHRVIADTPFKVIITTNYDVLLEQALRSVGKRFMKLVSNKEVAFADESKVIIVKIHGDVQQMESIVITEDDYWDFFRTRPNIAELLGYYAATKTLLFIGYGLADPDFNRICLEVSRNLGKYKRRAYAIQLQPSEYTRAYWRTKGIEILDADAFAFLKALHAAVPGVTVPPVREKIIDRRAATLYRGPYKFLDYYETEDAGIFFGREEDTDRLLRRILSHRLVILVGKSGVGKTSLTKAGIVPALPSDHYLAIYVKGCGDDMMNVIRQQLLDTVPREVAHVAPSTELLTPLLAHIEATLDLVVVIFLDQFEEFFVNLGDRARLSFGDKLSQVLSTGMVNTRFVICVREDFFVDLNELKPKIPSIFNAVYWLKKLTKEQAAQAIIQPAAEFGIAYEPQLVQALLDDLWQEGIEPPQLQIVCHRLYETLEAGEPVISLRKYYAAGGARQIMGEYLDQALKSFPAEDRAIIKGIMKALVTAEGTRSTLTCEELAAAVSTSQSKVRDLLAELDSRFRLVRTVESEGEIWYELVHEYLTDAIRKWLDETELEIKAVREMLRREVSDARRFGGLIHPVRLERINRYLDRLSLSEAERDLVSKSNRAYEDLLMDRKKRTAAKRLETLGEIAAGLVHRLNSPLGAIRLQTQLLEERTDKADEEALRYIRDIRTSVETALDLTSALWKPARPTEMPIDLNLSVEEALELVAVPEDINIVWQLDPHLPRVLVVPEQIVEVWRNLFDNAIAAMPEGGTLTVGSHLVQEEGQEFVEVRVTDTGIGIPKDWQDKIFQPFYTTKEKGMGFGLWWVTTYLRSTGGAISFASQLDQGTTFVVRLPAQTTQ